MPLALPNLDDRRYTDLVEEALGLIPTYAPEWTNYNASDPGIALIELFAYLSEMLIYRLNRVTDDNVTKFLKLLNGPEWEPRLGLNDETLQTVLSLREQFRAVTSTDFELLSTEGFNGFLTDMQENERHDEPIDKWWEVTGLDRTRTDHLPSQLTPIARAHCVAKRNLDAGTEAIRRRPVPDHVSMVIVPQLREINAKELGPQPTPPQLQALWKYLDGRRTLTTRHHVVGPFYAPVTAEILVARQADVPDDNVRRDILQTLERFFLQGAHPGDRRGAGWPFGHDLFVSELYEALEKVPGVDYVPDIMLESECGPSDQHCVTAEPIWHESGDFVGLRLFDHHLPAAQFDGNKIVIAPSTRFLMVWLEIKVTAEPGADVKVLKREIKAKVREFCHPLHDGPGPKTGHQSIDIKSNIEREIRRLTNVASIISVNLHSVPARLIRTGEVVTGVEVKDGEIIDLRVQVEV